MDRQLANVTSKSRADKAIFTLKGILLGINLDGEVTPEEVNELSKWAIEHNFLINKNPFNEFMSLIIEATNNNIPTKEAIQDLYWLSQKYEADTYYFNGLTSDLQLLQGICHGILADGILNDTEIRNLNTWLKSNRHLKSYYPYDEIRLLLSRIMEDKKIDDEERLLLKALLSQFVNITDKEIAKTLDAETKDVLLSGLCAIDPEIVFEGKEFCVTGILKRCPRQDLHRDIEALGGIAKNKITSKTDYLVVGDNGNEAWAFACYGRKVEEAITMRKSGHPITIIHEFDFCDILDDLLR